MIILEIEDTSLLQFVVSPFEKIFPLSAVLNKAKWFDFFPFVQ